MNDPLDLFNKIQVIAPTAVLRKAVLKKINAIEKDRITSFRFFAIAAGVCALIGTSLYIATEKAEHKLITGLFDHI